MASHPREVRVASNNLWTLLVGRPLRHSEASKEQITPVEGLSALSLDALTSVAYGPEAIIVVLAVGGTSALHLILPITIAIVVLLGILVISYRQVIDAYPGGGGAYAVSRANFGAGASLVAGASLIVDYTLTVAVSIAAGVASLTSAFPSLASSSVPICLGILAIITLLNLRGLGDSARAFLLPTFIFIIGLLAIIAVGLIHPLGLHEAEPGRSLLSTHGLQVVSVLLILKAFSAGCSALTGVEAIANGVPLFKPPRAQRAKRTELLLGLILGAMLLGLATLAHRWHVGPRSHVTVLSQIMGLAVGRHWAYYVVSLSITVVLALAANTSYGGLPVLASLLARDNYLPHLFGLRGDRQVFNSGVWVLGSLSAILLIAVGANTNELIPLFAIGVFTGFTLSQAGLVVHWWHERPKRWRYHASVNGIGAIVTGLATVIFLITKFTQGAWIVVVAVPLFITLFLRIHAYYGRVAIDLGIGRVPPPPQSRETLVIVPIVNVSTLTSCAISEALSLGQEVTAVTVVTEGDTSEDRERELTNEWNEWNPGIALRVLRTEYSSVVEPICEFIDQRRRSNADQIVVLIPVLMPAKFRYRILHNQLDVVLSRELRKRPDVVVARVHIALSTRGPTHRPRPRTPRRSRARHG
ncbi:MAG TPA: APC family permease [Acidimicrobiales bacterium]|nr:APC family permease [Acidimicrobiales bacterium]